MLEIFSLDFLINSFKQFYYLCIFTFLDVLCTFVYVKIGPILDKTHARRFHIFRYELWKFVHLLRIIRISDNTRGIVDVVVIVSWFLRQCAHRVLRLHNQPVNHLLRWAQQKALLTKHRIYKQQINTTNRNSMKAITMGPYKMSLFYLTTICCCFLSPRLWFQCGPLSWRPTCTTKQSQGTTYKSCETKYGPCILRHNISPVS